MQFLIVLMKFDILLLQFLNHLILLQNYEFHHHLHLFLLDQIKLQQYLVERVLLFHHHQLQQFQQVHILHHHHQTIDIHLVLDLVLQFLYV